LVISTKYIHRRGYEWTALNHNTLITSAPTLDEMRTDDLLITWIPALAVSNQPSPLEDSSLWSASGVNVIDMTTTTSLTNIKKSLSPCCIKTRASDRYRACYKTLIMKTKRAGFVYYTSIFLGLLLVPVSWTSFFEQACLTAIFIFLYICLMGELFFAQDEKVVGRGLLSVVAKSLVCSGVLSLLLFFAFLTYEQSLLGSSIFTLFFVLVLFLGPSFVLTGID